ncbi:MAG: hypothetical protein QM764_15740 [Chitinophagaceae bacterium]
MNTAKIRLSAKEMELAMNADWILTKNGIIEKGKILFGLLQDKMISHLNSLSNLLPPEALRIPPKISKGENYNGLPYLMLDYPRVFYKQNIFAIRTMFWWGNFFSITLHLGGDYKIEFSNKILKMSHQLRNSEFFLCINEEEWEHHFDATNYAAVSNLSSEEFHSIVAVKSFVKLAKKYPINTWDNAVEQLSDDFTIITGMLAG